MALEADYVNLFQFLKNYMLTETELAPKCSLHGSSLPVQYRK